MELLKSGIAWYYQLAIGLVYGFVAAFAGWQIIKTQLLSEVRGYYGDIIKSLNLNRAEIIFISFCAGVGEEILFRGAIQYWLGIWLTAILFVAIHGYLNPKNWKLSIYGAFMTFAIAGIGYFFEYFGIISAIAAHFMIDVYLFSVINPKNSSVS